MAPSKKAAVDDDWTRASQLDRQGMKIDQFHLTLAGARLAQTPTLPPPPVPAPTLTAPTVTVPQFSAPIHPRPAPPRPATAPLGNSIVIDDDSDDEPVREERRTGVRLVLVDSEDEANPSVDSAKQDHYADTEDDTTAAEIEADFGSEDKDVAAYRLAK